MAFAREMADATVLLHVLEPVTADAIDRAPHLRLIQKIGVGVNTIDLDAARRRGIAITNMPGTNTQAVAEATLLLMLAALRRLSFLDTMTRSGRGWCLPPDEFDRVGELSGRVVGLIGYGAVPCRLAPVLAQLGANVIFCAQSPKPEAVGTAVPLNEIIERADVISLHVPLTSGTRGMIGVDAIARMKPNAVLINTGRGALVDEAALLQALTSGRLGAAGLDVFALEPIDASHPFLSLNNVVLMPHVAWLTPETLERSAYIAVENCRRLRAGEPLLNRIA